MTLREKLKQMKATSQSSPLKCYPPCSHDPRKGQLQLEMPQAGRGDGNCGDSEKTKIQLYFTAGDLVTKYILAFLKRA